MIKTPRSCRCGETNNETNKDSTYFVWTEYALKRLYDLDVKLFRLFSIH
jgi:hypothetical protein